MNTIGDAIDQVVTPTPTKLARRLGRKRADEPTFHEDPKTELRSLVGRHKRWTRTAVQWEQSVSDRKIRIGPDAGKTIVSILPGWTKNEMTGAVEKLRNEATRLESAMLKQLRQIPIYREFLADVFGFGPITSAYLCAMIRIERSVKPSQLWRYCGNACDARTGKREIRSGGPKWSPRDEYDATQGGTYNDELKTRIWLAMTSMRRNAAKIDIDKPFGTTSKYLVRWASATYSRKTMGREKGAEDAGRRKATDLFLEDLYTIWRTLEGLPVWPDLYSSRRGYHHGGRPCVNEGRVLTLDEAFEIVGDFRARPAATKLMWSSSSESE